MLHKYVSTNKSRSAILLEDIDKVPFCNYAGAVLVFAVFIHP
jgi:hypothetical protein